MISLVRLASTCTYLGLRVLWLSLHFPGGGGGGVADASYSSVVVNLTQDFAEYLENPGAAQMLDIAKGRSKILTAMVIERGTMVFKYMANDADEGDERHVFSHTKAWTGLLMGLLIEEGLVSLDDTLGDIFGYAGAKNNTNSTITSIWDEADARDDAAGRSKITIGQMLSMTSGLAPPPPEDTPFSSLNSGNPGGSDLSSALASNFYNASNVGKYQYLMTSNVLSYVIVKKTGMTPRQYASAKVFPAFGIDDADIVWFRNDDGVESSFHGLELLPEHMAKFGQLFLQRGLYAPGQPLVSKAWMERSFAPQNLTDFELDGIMPTQSIWWLSFKEGFFCSMGAFGMQVCVDPATERVSIKQENIYDYFFSTNLPANLENIATGLYLDFHYYAFAYTYQENLTVVPSMIPTMSFSATPSSIPTVLTSVTPTVSLSVAPTLTVSDDPTTAFPSARPSSAETMTPSDALIMPLVPPQTTTNRTKVDVQDDNNTDNANANGMEISSATETETNAGVSALSLSYMLFVMGIMSAMVLN